MSLILLWGLPGSGKTTLQARYIKRNWFKYNHLYICGERLLPTAEIPEDYVTYIEPYEIGTFKPIPSSMFVFCDSSLYYSNRDFSKIPNHVINWFSTYRHYNDGRDPLVILDSQSIDIDLKIRQRVDTLYFVHKFPFITYCQHVRHAQDVDDQTHQLIDGYFLKRALKWLFLLGWLHDIFFIRRNYYGIFDTHSDLLFHGKEYAPKEIVDPKNNHRIDWKEYYRIYDENQKNNSKIETSRYKKSNTSRYPTS